MGIVSKLDADQVMRKSYSDADGGLKVIGVGGNLVPDKFDKIDMTYVTSGNGIGEIQTVVYSLNGNTIATLTLSYNVDNKLVSVERS
jgi:hypothetical protein